MYKRLFAVAAVTVAGMAMAVGTAGPALASPAVAPGWHDTGLRYGSYDACMYAGSLDAQSDPTIVTYDCRLQGTLEALWVLIS